jgi:hypothetical protein
MKRIERILEQITLNELISDYNNGIYFSEKANKIINAEKVDCEIVNYDDLYQVNFYEEDNDDILIATYNVKK